AALLPHRLIEPLAVERVLTQHERLEIVDQGLTVHLRAAHRGAEERVALHALVGADRQQAELARPAEPAGVAAVLRGGDVVPGKEGEADVADLHGGADATMRANAQEDRHAATTAADRKGSHVLDPRAPQLGPLGQGRPE